MKRRIATLVTCMLLASPLAIAQESGNYMAPKALDDEILTWMLGEWTGTNESAMGTMQESMHCVLGMNDQFLVMDWSGDMGPMKMKGRAVFTVTGGKYHGYWYDSMRNMSQGEGTRDGNVVTMTWKSPNGEMVRTIEKVDEDTFKSVITMPGPDGKDMEMVTTMTRVKKMG